MMTAHIHSRPLVLRFCWMEDNNNVWSAKNAASGILQSSLLGTRSNLEKLGTVGQLKHLRFNFFNFGALTNFLHYKAVITIAIRLRYDDTTAHSTTTEVIEITTCIRFDCDTTTIRLRRIARACFHSTQFDASKNEHVSFSS